MQAQYIDSVGGYLPFLRLERAAAVAALRWSGLGGMRQGMRTVAGWDEDALTIAVESARGLAADFDSGTLIFASTSAYFSERAQSAIMVDALALSREVRAFDVAGSRRCATSALFHALEQGGETIVAAGEKRPTQPGSPQQLGFGDGGAAVRVAREGAVRYLGGASLTHDLVDMYASSDHPTPYAYEERFVREVATRDVLGPVIRLACERASVPLEKIAWSAVAEPLSGVYPGLAKAVGLKAPNLASELLLKAGDMGAAHALYAFGLALAKASVGDIILLAGFGSGCDAMLFELVRPVPGASAMAEALDQGHATTDYVRFLNLTGGIDLAWGMRSEFQQKAQATVLERSGRDMIGFVGGRDSAGNVQFPKSRIPVNPALSEPETLEDVRLAEECGRIVSVTADRLNFTPDPPFDFGLVQFDNGARVMMEFTDRPAAGFAVGDAVRMRLRVKSEDRSRGFRTYFWKAAPVTRPALETE